MMSQHAYHDMSVCSAKYESGVFANHDASPSESCNILISLVWQRHACSLCKMSFVKCCFRLHFPIPLQFGKCAFVTYAKYGFHSSWRITSVVFYDMYNFRFRFRHHILTWRWQSEAPKSWNMNDDCGHSVELRQLCLLRQIWKSNGLSPRVCRHRKIPQSDVSSDARRIYIRRCLSERRVLWSMNDERSSSAQLRQKSVAKYGCHLFWTTTSADFVKFIARSLVPVTVRRSATSVG